MNVDFNQVNPEIRKILDALPTFYQLLDESSYVTVMDREGTVLGFERPANAKPFKEIGERMDDPSGGFDEVIRTGKRKYNYLPKEVLGEAGQRFRCFFQGNIDNAECNYF